MTTDTDTTGTPPPPTAERRFWLPRLFTGARDRDRASAGTG